VLIWDRKIDGGFPEAKVLKQRIRDYIDPKRDLGHSDKPASSTAANAATATAERQVAQTTSESSDPAQGATKACEDCA
jgi:Tfp pilus assembly protein PilX